MEEIAKYDGTSNTLMMSENPNVGSWLHAAYGPSPRRVSKEQFSQMLWFPEGYQKPNPPDPAYNPAFDAAPPALAFGLNRSVRDLTKAEFDGEPRYGRPGSYHPGGFNVVALRRLGSLVGRDRRLRHLCRD
jgi:hypothetical protein